MYSKQEAAVIRHRFWTALGKYLAPIPFAGNEKQNWINYKTGIKNIFFKTFADNKKASACIELAMASEEQREKKFHLLLNLIKQSGSSLKDWQTEKKSYNEQGKPVALIYMDLYPVNIYKEEDWPLVIGFLKEKMIAFDAFWTQYKDIIEHDPGANWIDK